MLADPGFTCVNIADFHTALMLVPLGEVQDSEWKQRNTFIRMEDRDVHVDRLSDIDAPSLAKTPRVSTWISRAGNVTGVIIVTIGGGF